MMKIIFKKLSTIILITAVFFTCAGTSFAAAFTYNSAVEKKLFSTAKLEDYVEPKTPAFDKDKGWNSFTTVKERNSYLKKLTKNNKYMSLYYKKNMSDTPIVFFTSEDMHQATDWKSAYTVLEASDKINIFYQAGLHGNEPAGAEGALYFLERIAADSEYAAYLAKHLNICVVPCANPDASAIKSRETSGGVNINRDNLYVRSKYTRLLHDLYNAFKPEIVMDSHECLSNMQLAPNQSKDYFTDVYLSAVSSLNVDTRLSKWSSHVMDTVLNDCRDAGLRVSIYDDADSTTISGTVSSTYYGLQGSISILIESMGINMGKSHFGRRVYSHYRAVSSILDTVIKNKKDIAEDVSAARNDVVERGKKFSSGNRFALKQKVTGSLCTVVPRNVYSSTTGKKITSVKYKVCWHDKIVRSRALPTAYIISKKTENADLVMRKLKYNGIEYFEIGPGAKVSVSSFSGNGEKASITEAKTLTFTKGAYVIPMDQTGAKVAATCLEPDIYETLSLGDTFVQSGLLKANQIYRYTKSNPRENLQNLQKSK